MPTAATAVVVAGVVVPGDCEMSKIDICTDTTLVKQIGLKHIIFPNNVVLIVLLTLSKSNVTKNTGIKSQGKLSLASLPE